MESYNFIDIKLIEENIETQLMASQKEMLDFYGKNNKKYEAPMNIDDQRPNIKDESMIIDVVTYNLIDIKSKRMYHGNFDIKK